MSKPEQIVLEDRTIELDRRVVVTRAGEVELRPMEARLLAELARHDGVPVSREDLLAAVWGYCDGVVSRTVDTTVKTLRRKLEPEPASPRYLLTTRGVGYRLAVSPIFFDTGDNPIAAAGELRGRERDLAALIARLDGGTRLVHLLGPPGVGKSRLVEELSLRHPRRPSIVRLEAVSQIDEVVRRVGDPTLLGSRPLILDGTDQLAPHLAGLLRSWLRGAPKLQVVMTSRAVLGMKIESVQPLGPLAAPSPEADTLEAILEAPAARMFVDRVRTDRPGFCATIHDAHAVAAIVRKLDGIPLDLTMAAGLARVLDPAAILRALDKPLAVLSRPQAERGWSSVEEAIGQSWTLLDDQERHVLAALSTFRRSFALEEGVAVAGGRGSEDPTACILKLADKSLVARANEPGRLRLFSSIRAFAADRLGEHPDGGHAAHSRHADLFASRADLLGTGHESQGSVEELFAAMRWACQAGNTDTAGALGHSLLQIAYYRGRGPELAVAVRRALQRIELPVLWHCRFETWRAIDLLGARQPTDAARLAAALLNKARSRGDRAAERRLLGILGSAALLAGMPQRAAELHQQAVEVARSLDDRRHLGRALLALASVSDHPTPLLREAVDCCGEGKDHLFMGKAMALLGAAELEQGHPGAEAHLRWSVRLACASGNVRSEGMRRLTLARALRQASRLTEAREEAAEALRCSRTVADRASACKAQAFLSSLPERPVAARRRGSRHRRSEAEAPVRRARHRQFPQ